MKELYTFFLFILTGMSIGILFDFFRIIRKNFKTKDFITYIHDFLFWIFAGVILLYSIFTFNNGELRGYIIIGILIGTLIHILIFSKLLMEISSKIIEILKKIFSIPINFFICCTTNIINKYKEKINFNYLSKKLKNNKNDKISNKIQ